MAKKYKYRRYVFFSIPFPGTVIQTIAHFFDTQISNVCKTGTKPSQFGYRTLR